MRRVLILLAMVALGGWRHSVEAADEPGGTKTVRPLEWNVLLDGWQLLGPFPKTSDDPEGLATRFVKDEAGLQAGRVTFYDRKLYTWVPYNGRMINFRDGLKAQGGAGNDKVAYAWTQFSSSAAQKARLAVGYDDHFIAWLNGKEVSRGNESTWGSLDQEVAAVDLLAGTNTLVLKVANGSRGWEGLVRLLPAKPVAPLLEFQVAGAGNANRLPVIEIELLDAKRKSMALHRCGGGRGKASYNSAIYRLFADAPAAEPAFAKFRTLEPGFSTEATTVAWKRLQRGGYTLTLATDRPAEVLVVDAKTKQPIQGATIWRGKQLHPSTTDAQGRIQLTEFTPLTDRCHAVAPGFAVKDLDLSWPRRGVKRVELSPGGRSVVGTIVSTDGDPVAGATVWSAISGTYSPIAVTDEQGRFEFVGIPESRTRIYPTIEAAGFVSKGRFSLDLKEPETNVRWELAPGATIAGRIVDRASGQPVAGVTIKTGESRFGGSNDPQATTTSGADGTYELTGVPAGETLIHAFSDDFAPAMQRATAVLGSPVKLDFEIEAGRSVTGVIRDKDGRPVPDVRLITDTWNGARMFARETRTGADGRFELAHMPDSQAEVHVLKRGFISQRDLKVTGGDTVELTLLPTIVHTISIRDAAKKQIVPDLQIAKGYLWAGNSDWYWQNNDYETDRFYDKLKGEMRIEIDEQNSSYEIAYRFRAAGFAEQVVNLPRDLSEGKTIELLLRPAEVFEGRVVDASTGLPLKDVIVAAVSREDRLRTDQYSEFHTPWEFMQQSRSTAVRSTTDGDGRFRLPAQSRNAPGAGLVLMAKDGGFHYVDGDIFAALGDANPGAANPGAAKDAVLELPMPTSASLSGRLTIGGKPVAGTNVRIQWNGHGNAAQNDWNRAFGVGGQVETDADGRFSFPHLGPGTYQLNRVFRIPLGDSQSMTAYLDSENVTLRPGAYAVHDFARPAGVKVSGVAKTVDGKPVGGCVIYANDPSKQNARVDGAIADAEGRFTFEHLAPGDYQLQAELQVRHPEGYYNLGLSGTSSVSVTDATDGVEITLVEVNQNQTVRLATPLAGTLAPEFSVTSSGEDAPLVLSELYGKVVVVCFWAGDDSMVAALNAMHRQFKENEDVVLVPVFLQGAVILEHLQRRLKEQPEFPIVAGKSVYSIPLVDLFSSSGGAAVGYVIGRDGRFVTEAVSLQQLGTSIEQALEKPLNVTLTKQNAATLSVSLSSDQSDRGITGAKLKLRAIDAAGKTVREDRFEIVSTPKRIHWNYPPAGNGGRLEVELSGRGIPQQQKTVARPSRSESIAFDNASPRRITGTVLNAVTGKPQPDVVLIFRSGFGQVMSARSDAAGRIDVPSYPGSFYFVAAQDSGFAVASSALQSVTVSETADPASLEIKVAETTTVKGRVLDAAGEPIPGALVMTQASTFSQAAEDGTFELPGVSSVGQTQLWATSDGQQYGAANVDGGKAGEGITIRIGQGLGGTAVVEPSHSVGQAIPSLSVLSLDGTTATWNATADSDRLVVIGALWHPATKALIAKARTWCEQNGKPLQVLSLDWSLEQARRESESQGLPGQTLFAGPGTLGLSNQWSLPGDRMAVLVAKDGTLVSEPLK